MLAAVWRGSSYFEVPYEIEGNWRHLVSQSGATRQAGRQAGKGGGMQGGREGCRAGGRDKCSGGEEDDRPQPIVLMDGDRS